MQKPQIRFIFAWDLESHQDASSQSGRTEVETLAEQGEAGADANEAGASGEERIGGNGGEEGVLVRLWLRLHIDRSLLRERDFGHGRRVNRIGDRLQATAKNSRVHDSIGKS